jgi:predicted transcriptional regulator
MYAKPRTFLPRETEGGRSAVSSKRIEAALLQLISNQPFERVTMAGLADRVGLARSTVYRKFADATEVLWAVSAPSLGDVLRAALAADRPAFDAANKQIWRRAGLVRALASASAQNLRGKLAELAAAEIERVTRRRDASACGLVIAGAWFALLEAYADQPEAPSDALSELMSLIYVSAFLTPQGLGAVARRQAGQISGGFPAAVSVRESLADPTRIISMIDGKPYRLLTRHIARYGMSPDQYRRCFGLPQDYPMVAPAYSAKRRKLARAIGLGTKVSVAA